MRVSRSAWGEINVLSAHKTVGAGRTLPALSEREAERDLPAPIGHGLRERIAERVAAACAKPALIGQIQHIELDAPRVTFPERSGVEHRRRGKYDRAYSPRTRAGKVVAAEGESQPDGKPIVRAHAELSFRIALLRFEAGHVVRQNDATAAAVKKSFRRIDHVAVRIEHVLESERPCIDQ